MNDRTGEPPRAAIPVYYSSAFVNAKHEFDTTRKAAWVAASLVTEPIRGIELVEPALLSDAELLLAHDVAYVDALRHGEPPALASSSGFPWDPGVWPMARASNGGAVAAALDAMRTGGIAGSLSSGLHHAKRGRGEGFCTVNGLAIAARRALAEGAGRVLVLDLDAHCGGGTADILRGDSRIVSIDLAVSPFDLYSPPRDWSLDHVADVASYLPTLRARLEGLDPAAIDLVLYNAGMDPHEDCDVGGLRGMTLGILSEREWTVFDWVRRHRLPTAFVLAGGYVGDRLPQRTLVALHRMTIAAAADG